MPRRKFAVEVVAVVGKNKAALSAARRLNAAVLASHQQEEVARLLDALEREEKARDRDLPAGRKRRNRIMRQLMANEAFFRMVQEWDRLIALTPLRPQWMPEDWLKYRSVQEQKLLAEKIGRQKGTESFVARWQRKRDEIAKLILDEYNKYAHLPEKERRRVAIREVRRKNPQLRHTRVYKVVGELLTHPAENK